MCEGVKLYITVALLILVLMTGYHKIDRYQMSYTNIS